MGEGDRSLWRHAGRRRELGDTGEIGDSGERGGVVDFTGDDASEDMLTVGHWEGRKCEKLYFLKLKYDL